MHDPAPGFGLSRQLASDIYLGDSTQFRKPAFPSGPLHARNQEKAEEVVCCFPGILPSMSGTILI